MIELQLDDTYKITSDKLNFVLEKYDEVIDLKTKQPNGTFKWKDVGYFGTNLNHALHRYVTETIRSEGNTDVSRLIEILNKLSKHIDNVVKQENIKIIVKEKDND